MTDETTAATAVDDRPNRRLSPAALAGGARDPDQLPAIPADDDYGADAGAGFENVGSDELLVPFIRILQALSPQCDEANGGAAFNPAARPGMVINTATAELFDGKRGFAYLPAHRDHTFPEFIPRDAGGGFVSVWSAADPRLPALQAAQGRFGKLALESGNELTETFSLYGLMVPFRESFDPARGVPTLDDLDLDAAMQSVIGFTSTQIKTYRTIIARLAAVIGQPPRFPLFAHVWHVRTVPQKNKKGSFFGWSFGLLGAGVPQLARLRTSSGLYQQAKAFNELLRAGAVRANYAAEGGGEDAGDSASEDGEVPF